MFKISIRAARVNAELSQNEAANLLGVCNKTISNWENRITFPPTDKIPAICEVYGVPYDHLNFLPSNSLKAKS